MQEYYVDMHVHIGRSLDGVITKKGTSVNLTLSSIAYEARHRKGINVIGLADCVSPWIIRDIEELLDAGDVEEIPEGGLLYDDDLLLLLGSEIETRERNRRAAHSLVFFPAFAAVKEFAREMDHHMTNLLGNACISRLTGQELFDICDALGGVYIPAHVFTPHKSFYGTCADRLSDIFSREALAAIPSVELGLSSDTGMACRISELDGKTFLSNSDAHSLAKIGREYNVMALEALNYQEIMMALNNEGGRHITANYGLLPSLGKYHRTFCLTCGRILTDPPPLFACTADPSHRVVVGVRDRLEIIKDREDTGEAERKRPPYHYQIPLEFLPGVGKHTIQRLIEVFGNEMNILHKAGFDELTAVTSEETARRIVKARSGELAVSYGGGGLYGRVEAGANKN